MLKVREAENQSEFEAGQKNLFADQKSFLQSYQYGQMQKKLGHEPFYLVFEQDNQADGNQPTTIVYALLLVLFKAKRGTYLFCPYGQHNAEQMAVLLVFLKAFAKSHQVDFLRFSPLMKDDLENRQMFIKMGFKNAPIHMMHPELTWILDINKEEKKLLEGMRKNTRYALKQAEKMPIKILEGNNQELLMDFYNIHEETSKRQGFVHYPWAYLKAQLEEFKQTDQIKIYIAEYEGKKIAGAVIMFYGDEGVYHHGASLSEYNKIPASYLIQWQAIKEAKRRDLNTYNFFGIVENLPKHPWAGLSFFKKGFGGESKSILHCQDMPLTKKYWLNLWVEKIRKIKRGY